MGTVRRPVISMRDPIRSQLANPETRYVAALKLVDRFKSCIGYDTGISNEFWRFQDWLSKNLFYREDFGNHFIDAWNERAKGIGECWELFCTDEKDAEQGCKMYMKPRPMPKSETKQEVDNEGGRQNMKATKSFSPIIVAVIILAISAIIVAIIIKGPRYKNTSNGCVLDTQTGLLYPRGTGAKPIIDKR